MRRTCGDFGGRSKDGSPCGIPSNDGPCGLHREGADRREILLTPEQIAEVERMAELACTHDEIAHILDISPRTLRNRMDDQPEVRAAYQRGVANGHREVKLKLREKIRKGNTAAIIFYLKTQCGWSEKHQVEVTGRDGGPVEYRSMSPEEKASRIADLLSAAVSRN